MRSADERPAGGWKVKRRIGRLEGVADSAGGEVGAVGDEVGVGQGRLDIVDRQARVLRERGDGRVERDGRGVDLGLQIRRRPAGPTITGTCGSRAEQRGLPGRAERGQFGSRDTGSRSARRRRSARAGRTARCACRSPRRVRRRARPARRHRSPRQPRRVAVDATSSSAAN